MPLIRSAGICSVVHISLQMRNSSYLAPHDPRYASIGMMSQPVAFPLRRASKQSVTRSHLESPPAPPCSRGSDFHQTRAAGEFFFPKRHRNSHAHYVSYRYSRMRDSSPYSVFDVTQHHGDTRNATNKFCNNLYLHDDKFHIVNKK